MRPGEASKIETAWCGFNHKTPHIVIPPMGSKNKQSRLVRLPSVIVQNMKAQLERATDAGSPYLFWSVEPRTKRFKPYAYSTMFRLLRKKLNLATDIVPHSIRHEIVSRYFAETSLSETAIAKIVGHKDIASLRAYKHFRVNEFGAEQDEFVMAQIEKVAGLAKP